MIDQLVDPFIEKVAADFWGSAGINTRGPRDLAFAARLTLPLDIVALPDLSVQNVKKWLQGKDALYLPDVPDSPLFGLLALYRGNGVIFLEEKDDHRNQRFTLAHEVAHFLLDCSHPRERAVQWLGTKVLDIFDGRRSATQEEQIISAFTDMEMTPHVHLLPRFENTGAWVEQRGKAEERADVLALELLAPAYEVSAVLREQGVAGDYTGCLSTADNLLREVYELPELKAGYYARRLARGITGGPSMFTLI